MANILVGAVAKNLATAEERLAASLHQEKTKNWRLLTSASLLALNIALGAVFMAISAGYFGGRTRWAPPLVDGFYWSAAAWGFPRRASRGGAFLGGRRETPCGTSSEALYAGRWGRRPPWDMAI